MKSGIGQRSAELWTKKTRELLILSNSRLDPAGARIGKEVCLQYEVDLGTHCQRASRVIEVRVQGGRHLL